MKDFPLSLAVAVSALATIGGLVVMTLSANAIYHGAQAVGLGFLSAPLAVAIALWALWEFCNFPHVLTGGRHKHEVLALMLSIANVCVASFYLTLPLT